MGLQLVKNGKSPKGQNACDDQVIKFEQPMDGLRIPMNEQEDLYTCDVLVPNMLFSDNNNPNLQPQTDDEFTACLRHVNLEIANHMLSYLEPIQTSLQKNCSDYRPKNSQFTRGTIPSKQEVKEDLVKTEKKGIFITVEAMKRNPKKPPYICFINMIIGCFLLLALIFYIKSVMAANFSFRSGSCSTNYSSGSPRLEAESCRSFNDGKTYLKLRPSPVSCDTQTIRPTFLSIFTSFHSFLVSYPMRISVSQDKVHQVFLNFRGEQLRFNFVSHLSDAFERHEIKFFIDNNEQRGKDLKHLFVRIEESSIALAIFSTRYPESSWCMDELVKMKKLADQGKLRVIPIFYNVEAGDVRKPTGDSEFGKNFWRLAEVSTGDQIKRWKEALESISDKMGLPLGEKRSESDFVKEIVKQVLRVIEAFDSRKKRVIFGK